MELLGLIITIIGFAFAFKPIKNKIKYYYIKFFSSKKKVPKNGIYVKKPVNFSVPLILKSGSQFIETAFSLPINEDELYDFILVKRSRILVLSQAGFGKTQLTLRLYSEFKNKKSIFLLSYICPDFRRYGPLYSQISTQFDFAKAEIKQIKKNETAIIIIDGLDELYEDEKNELLNESEEWIAKGASVFATARNINSLPSRFRNLYNCFTIQPLPEKNIFQIVNKWGKEKNIPPDITKKIERKIENQLGEESVWAPGDYDIAFSSPFYLVKICEFFVQENIIPKKRVDLLEMIVNKEKEDIKYHKDIIEKVLLIIAELAASSESSLSTPWVELEEAENKLDNLEESISIDYKSVLYILLETSLLTKIGEKISFGIHGLIYNLYASRNTIINDNLTAKYLKKENRNTLEFVLCSIEKSKAESICIKLLNEVEKDYPINEKMSFDVKKIDPIQPYYGLSSIEYVDMEIIDRFLKSAIDRFKIAHGPTRWKGVEMVASLSHHSIASKQLIMALNENEPDIAADIAEAICWLGNKRRCWRDWAIEELERVARYSTDYHPLLHVLEAVERLKVEKSPRIIELCNRLYNHDNNVVKFVATSIVGENEDQWASLGESVIEWIIECTEKDEIDYRICHGYHALHWFRHDIFGSHPKIDDAKHRIMDRVSILCNSAECPFYWIWYLGNPIIILKIIDDCKARFQMILADDTIPDEGKKSIRNFLVSLGGRYRY